MAVDAADGADGLDLAAVWADDRFLDAIATADPNDPHLDPLARLLAAWRYECRRGTGPNDR